MDFNRYKYSSMVITDYNFTVPLDYRQKEEQKISTSAAVGIVEGEDS